MRHNKELRNRNIYRIIKWYDGFFCPRCHSKELLKHEDNIYSNHAYECLDCGDEFYIDGFGSAEYDFHKKDYTKKEAMNIFRKIRWEKGVYCPYCNSDKYHKRGKEKSVQKYQCKNDEYCGKTFNDLTNTIFENSKIPMNEMFYMLSHIFRDDITIEELSGNTNFSLHSIEKKAKLFKDCFKSEKEEKKTFSDAKLFYLGVYLEDMAKKNNFPSNIINDHVHLVDLILKYDPRVFEKVLRKREKQRQKN